MPHYYYIDHNKQSSAQSDSSDRGHQHAQSQFVSSSEILHGKYFLFGQSVWIICQLLGTIDEHVPSMRSSSGIFDLVDKLLTITDLDPIRRFLPPCDRPKPNSRYSSIQVIEFTNFSMSGRRFNVSQQLGLITISIRTEHIQSIEQGNVRCQEERRCCHGGQRTLV